MRMVKTRPRFRCDFCRKVLTEAAMERHERMCWNNPERYCGLCENTGVSDEHGTPCYFCSQKWAVFPSPEEPSDG